MSLLSNHGVIGGTRLIPQLVINTTGTDTDANYSVAAGTPATNGNFIVIISGGTQSRTIVTNPSSGFTHVSLNIGTGTLDIWYKFANSESGNYGIEWSGSLQGGWSYFEFTNVDPITPLNLESHSNSGVLVPSFQAIASYNISNPGVCFQTIALSSASSTWVVDNSFLNGGGINSTLGSSGSSGGLNTIFKAAYRIHTTKATNEVTTWTTANQRIVLGAVIFFNGKLI